MAPAYLEKLTLRELREREEQLHELMRECVVCPRECCARRTAGRYGVCRTTDEIVVSSASPHFGEEPPLVGKHGSGTIFFTSCNLKCVFCQNFEISHARIGTRISTERLAATMISLQQAGCHNINLVTPTHVMPQIVHALVIAVEKGLSIPIVYNCGGYESVNTLGLLDGIVDIYMPDIKYSDNENARKYSGAPDYWDVVRKAIREMQRQVGCLWTDDDCIAVRGLIVRHLVLPNRIAGSRRVLEFIASDISVDSYVNIMDQYRPAYRAGRYSPLARSITLTEHQEAIDVARSLGLHRGFRRQCLKLVTS